MRSLLAVKKRILPSATGPSYYPKNARFIGSHYSHSPHFCVEDASTVADALNFAESSASSFLGTQIHGRLIRLGLSNEVFSLNNLMKMYANCGVFRDARKVFDKMPERNLVSWTLIISGANKNGVHGVSLESFIDMMRTGYLLPNEFAFGSIMKACTSMGANEFGLCVHCLALKIGMERKGFVGSSILHMYSKLGFVEAAERVFESFDGSDLGCWNAMVGCYAQCGYALEALKTVSSLHSKGVMMDEFSFVHALNGCSIACDLDFGSQIHGLMVGRGFQGTITLTNSLIDMYFKSGAKDLALKLFVTMENKDVVSWNTMFVGSSQDTDVEAVARLFSDFVASGVKPNHITFSILFRTCGEVLELDLGLQLYSLAFRLGLHDEPHVSSCVISMLCRCGRKEIARSVFDSLPSKNVQNWNEMIHGYNCSHDPEALKLFTNLWNSSLEADECTLSCAVEACFGSENIQVARQVHGIIVKSGFASNTYVCSSLIQGYTKFGFLADSYAFFNGVENMEITSWGALISTLANQGYTREAVKFLGYLKRHERKADEFILGSVLNACASIASLSLTKSVHGHVLQTGFDIDEYVASALIDAYGKSGDIKSATLAFHASREFPDVALFNTMIMAYANHGLVTEAMDVYERMKAANLKPSQSTFVAVISACSHKGLVDAGRSLFGSITSDYKMDPSPDNFGCLVDLLSRNGCVQEAKGVIEAMPFRPWPGVWRSLLNGCRIHRDKEVGEIAAEKLVNLCPESASAAYLLLSKMHSEGGNWEDAEKVRKVMVDKAIKKDLGCSWISI